MDVPTPLTSNALPPSLPGGVLAVLGLLAIVSVYRSIVYPLYLSPLSGIPGPKLAALTSMYLDYFWYRETALALIENLHHKYGPIVRIGSSEIVTNDPEQLVPIYGARSTMIKVPQINIMDNHSTPNTFSAISKEEHRYRRRFITQVYSAGNLVKNGPMLDFLRDRVGKVDIAVDTALGKPLDLHLLSRRFVIDNVTFQVYGTSWNLLGGEHLNHAGDITNTIIGAIPMWRVGTILNLLSLRPFRALLPQFIRDMQRSQRDLEATNLCYAKEVLGADKMVQDPHQNTVNSLRHQFKEDKDLTEAHIASECLDNVVAGTDAPAAAITYLIHELAMPKNHKYQVRLREELQSLSNPLDFSEVSKLPFLNTLVYESLRLYPPGPGSMQQRMTVEPTSLVVHGKTYQLPSNTVVGLGAYVLHRSKEIYGADVLEFKPERWDERDKERLQKMKEAWVPFGTGTRVCPGQPLAILEAKVLIATLLRDRSVRLPPDWCPDDMAVQQAVVIRPKAMRCHLIFDKA